MIMMNFKKLTALTLAGMMTVAGCASAVMADGETEAIKAEGKVIMTTNAEFEPFEYKDGDQIIGIDAEIAQKIAEKLGVELEIVDIAFDSLIPSLNAGKADFIAAGMTATDERRKNVDFSDDYFNASQTIIVSVDSDITSREDLNGRTVGVQQGTTGDIYVTNEDGSGDITVKEVRRYPKGMDAVSDLLTGRIEAVVIDDFPANKLVEKNPDKIKLLDEAMTEETYAIAVPLGSDLIDTINEVIKELNESGEMDEIVGKYISADQEG
jgi:polar amino acid transport system substrate-binding protein